ncbi:MAG TPA: regulatory protein RecX [Thiopseudomonas sp.]|nr:regulatory protein RecX [Thiopseudomonas sp.]
MLDTPVSIRRASMNLLARREHGHVELARKLKLRGADAHMIEVELQRLTEDGLLSEERYLESYVRSRANEGRGPMRIREELTQRGLARADVDQALSEAQVDWDERMRELWQRRFDGQIVDLKDKAKQSRFLAQRGYALDAIRSLLDAQGWAQSFDD